MNLQVIKSKNGYPEYVLLPIDVYNDLRPTIDERIKELRLDSDDYELFDVSDYVENPVALARIQAHITQKTLSELMNVSQAYISKLENQEKVTPKVMAKVEAAIKLKKDKK